MVLAPMAGVTNRAFRRLCRGYGAALLVSEMVNARGLVEQSARSAELTAFDDDETTRSLQIYGSDPVVMGEAVRRLVGDHGVGHVDINFGCPVRKVTRHGGGAAVPARPRLLAAIVAASVAGAGEVPVTVKMRLGLDEERMTFLAAARAAADSGAAAVALHARTAEQMYSGSARWDRIGDLVAAIGGTVPVLGNGDIWEAEDAVAMMRQTGCDGVVVGRGCLGRPWLFGDLARAFGGEGARAVPEPTLGTVVDAIGEHVNLLADHLGAARAVLDIRKHIGWYLTGYPVGGDTRRALMSTNSIDQLHEVLDGLDRHVAWPQAARGRPRGTRRGPAPVVVPEGWCSAEADAPPAIGDGLRAVSGG